MQARERFRANPERARAPSNVIEGDFANAMSFGHAYGVLCQYGIRVFLDHVRESNDSRLRNEISHNEPLRSALHAAENDVCTCFEYLLFN